MDMQSHISTQRIELPALPYAMNALEPFISKETLQYHYGKHHRAYVNKLNSLLPDSEFEDLSLEEIVRRSSHVIFNNAAQVWNHNFYWQCLAPAGGGKPAGDLARQIIQDVGSLDAFKLLFTKKAIEKFGSGWTWLIKTRAGQLVVRNSDDADTPLRLGDTALLACDVWEHAYYIDHRNDRARYIDAFWHIVNWRFVEENFSRQGSVQLIVH